MDFETGRIRRNVTNKIYILSYCFDGLLKVGCWALLIFIIRASKYFFSYKVKQWGKLTSLTLPEEHFSAID